MKDFLTDEEMQALENKPAPAPDFISDEEMAKIEQPAPTAEVALPPAPIPEVQAPPEMSGFEKTRLDAFSAKRPNATPEENAQYLDALQRAQGVNPELSTFQSVAAGPTGRVTEAIGNIPAAVGQTVETAKQQLAALPPAIGRKVGDALMTYAKVKDVLDRTSKNVPTAVAGLINMTPAFTTEFARGATDVVASGADLIGQPNIGNKIREEGKLAADTAKQWAGLETNRIREVAGEKPVDVVEQGIAEELTPQKKQGALAKAMRSKFLFDAENMTPERFKAKYPEALPVDQFTAKFEEVLADNSLPQTMKSFFVDMPVESVKTIYGAISGDPETWQRFNERPAETIAEVGVGLGIGAKTIGELKGVAKDMAGVRPMLTERMKGQTQEEFNQSFAKNQQQELEFLRKQRIQKEMDERAQQPIGEPKFTNVEPPTAPPEAQAKMNEQTDFLTGKTEVQPTIEPVKPTDKLFQRKQAQGTPQTVVEEPAKENIPPAEQVVPEAKETALAEEPVKTERPADKTEYFNIPTKEIDVEPERFQFKSATDKEGVTNLYKDVKFDASKYEPIFVWKDTKDGRYKVIDGHHRLEIARRSGIENIDVRDASKYGVENEADAKIFGALRNIALDRGTPFDAAKIFREMNITTSADMKNNGINPKMRVAKQGLSLSKLSDLVWEGARNNVIPEETAAILGDLNHTQQNSVYKQIIQYKNKYGEFPEKNKTKALVDSVSNMEGEGNSEIDMFGDVVETQPVWEKASVVDYIQRELAQDKRAFKISTNEKIGERLEGTGTGKLDKQKGAEELQSTLTTIDVFNKLKDSKGKIADILNSAAQRIANGENKVNIFKEALNNVKSEIASEYSKYYEGNKSNAERGRTASNVSPEEEIDMFQTTGLGMMGGKTEVQPTIEPVKPTDKLFQRKQAQETPQTVVEPTKENILKDYSSLANDNGAKAFEFGSRVKGTAKEGSDYDIIIKPSDALKYSNAQEYTQAVTPILNELKKKYPNTDIQISKDDGYINMLVEDARLNREANLKQQNIPPAEQVAPEAKETALVEEAANKLLKKGKTETDIFMLNKNGEVVKAPYSDLKKTEANTNFERMFAENNVDPNLAKIKGPFKSIDEATLNEMARGYNLDLGFVKVMKNKINEFADKTPTIAEATQFANLGELLTGKDAKEMFKDVYDIPVELTTETRGDAYAWTNKNGKRINISIPKIKDVSLRGIKEILTHEAQHAKQLKNGMQYNGTMDYKENPLEIEAYDIGGKYRSGKLSMLGTGELQNLYEKAEPTLKKGVDILKRKGKEFVADESGSLDLGALYDRITGGKVERRKVETTIGDPALQKELTDMFERGRAIQEKQMKEAQAKRQTTGSAIKQSLIDAYSPLLDKTWNGLTPEKREKLMKTVHDTFYVNSYAEGFLREFADNILKPVKADGMTYDDYNGYLTARNIAEGRKNVASKWTPAEAQDYLSKIDPAKKAILDKATTDFHEKVWKPLLNDLVENKLADAETIKNIIDNDSYAPTFFQKFLELDYGKREHGPSSGIYSLDEGSTADFMDPTAMKLQKGMAMIAAGKINKAKYNMVEAMRESIPNEVIEAQSKITGFREVDDPANPGQKLKDPKDPTKNLKIPVREFLEPKGASGMSLVTYRDGKDMKGVYVPKEIAAAFDAASGGGEQLGAAMKFWSKGNQMFRNMWIEYNPFWQVFTNLPKDAATAAVLFPDFKSKGTLIKNLAKTQSTALMGDFAKLFGGLSKEQFEKNKTEMLKRGETMSSVERQYATEPELDIADRLFKMYGVEEGKKGFFQKISDFGKDIEAATKMAARMTIEERGLKSKFTPEEQVNIVRRTGSPAFPVRGFGELNTVVKNGFMFYNAMKEGWRAAYYLAKKDPYGAAAAASVPLGLYAVTLAAEHGAFGDDIKNKYKKMNSNHKKMNITLPLWESENGEINYLTIPMAPFLAPFTDAMRLAVKDNPRLVSSIIGGVTNNALPMVNPILQNIMMLYSADKQNAPVNMFTGQKAVTDDQWKEGGMVLTEAMARQFWNNYLLGSQWRLPVDKNDPKNPEFDLKKKMFTLVFGKLIRTSLERPSEGIDEIDRKEAKTRRLTKQIVNDPENAEQYRQEMKEENLIPTKVSFKNAAFNKMISKMKPQDAEKAMRLQVIQQEKNPKKKYLLMKQLNELFGKKK